VPLQNWLKVFVKDPDQIHEQSGSSYILNFLSCLIVLLHNKIQSTVLSVFKKKGGYQDRKGPQMPSKGITFDSFNKAIVM